MESDRETSYQCPVIYLLSWKVRAGAVLELLGAGCNAWLGTGQEKRGESISNSSCLYALWSQWICRQGAPLLPLLWNLLPVSNLIK